MRGDRLAGLPVHGAGHAQDAGGIVNGIAPNVLLEAVHRRTGLAGLPMRWLGRLQEPVQMNAMPRVHHEGGRRSRLLQYGELAGECLPGGPVLLVDVGYQRAEALNVFAASPVRRPGMDAQVEAGARGGGVEVQGPLEPLGDVGPLVVELEHSIPPLLAARQDELQQASLGGRDERQLAE